MQYMYTERYCADRRIVKLVSYLDQLILAVFGCNQWFFVMNNCSNQKGAPIKVFTKKSVLLQLTIEINVMMAL